MSEREKRMSRLHPNYLKKKEKKNFDFALTSYCQAKCRSCTRMDESNPGQVSPFLKLDHFDLEVFRRIVSNSKAIWENNHYIQFCGELGDPCMHPQIEDFIDVAWKYGGGVHINTNGGLRKPEWYKHIAEKYDTGPKDRRSVSIKWGIDGADHETNWMYREGVDWQRAMDNMTAWFEADGEGEWHFIIFEWNWHQIFQAYELAQNIKNCEIFFKFNGRAWGKISPENKKTALAMLEEIEGRVMA